MARITIHLGVQDIPYVNDQAHTVKPVRKGKKWRRSDIIGGEDVTSTGAVAEILEARYHVMEIFAEEHMADVIGPAVANALAGELENRLMGAPDTGGGMLEGAMSAIETSFKKFISDREMERLGYPGVPTKAALRGVDHRKKHPYAKRPSRPSFRDTGLFQANFRAWKG